MCQHIICGLSGYFVGQKTMWSIESPLIFNFSPLILTATSLSQLFGVVNSTPEYSWPLRIFISAVNFDLAFADIVNESVSRIRM